MKTIQETLENPTYPIKVKVNAWGECVWTSDNFSRHDPDFSQPKGEQAVTQPLRITYIGDRATIFEFK